MAIDYTYRATEAVEQTCREVLGSVDTYQGPRLDVYIAAVDEALTRRNVPAPSAEMWKRVAVALGARCAGYERRAAVDLEMAWAHVAHAVHEYERRVAAGEAWQAAHPEPLADGPRPGQEVLL